MEIVCLKKAGKANIDKDIWAWYTTENFSHPSLLGIVVDCRKEVNRRNSPHHAFVPCTSVGFIFIIFIQEDTAWQLKQANGRAISPAGPSKKAA
jgi:hypothetical protein